MSLAKVRIAKRELASLALAFQRLVFASLYPLLCAVHSGKSSDGDDGMAVPLAVGLRSFAMIHVVSC